MTFSSDSRPSPRGWRSTLTRTDAGRRRGADDPEIAQRRPQALPAHVHFGVLAVDLDYRAFEPERADGDPGTWGG